MTDIELAKNNLMGHTLSLCRDGVCLTSDKKGIAPMLGFIEEGRNLVGFSVADRIVGKAAALLFAKAGIARVHALVLSLGGKETLERYKIPYTFDALTKSIINRAGTDVCPMERTVAEIDDCEKGYAALLRRALEMNI